MSEERCYPRLSEWMTTYTYHENHKCVVEKVYYVKGPQEKDPLDLIVYKNEDGQYASVSRRSADANWVRYEYSWKTDTAYEREGWNSVIVRHIFMDGAAAWEQVNKPTNHGVFSVGDRKHWNESK